MFTSSTSSQRSKAPTLRIGKTPKEYIELEDFLKHVHNNPDYKLTEQDKKLLPSFNRGQVLGKMHVDLFLKQDNADTGNKKKINDIHDEINKILPNLNNKQVQDLARTLMGIRTDNPNQEISALLNEFGDDKDKITNIFRESLKTSLKKDTSWFIPGIREDTEKTKAKLGIICETLTYDVNHTKNIENSSNLDIERFSGNNRDSSRTNPKNRGITAADIGIQQIDSKTHIPNSKRIIEKVVTRRPTQLKTKAIVKKPSAAEIEKNLRKMKAILQSKIVVSKKLIAEMDLLPFSTDPELDASVKFDPHVILDVNRFHGNSYQINVTLTINKEPITYIIQIPKVDGYSDENTFIARFKVLNSILAKDVDENTFNKVYAFTKLSIAQNIQTRVFMSGIYQQLINMNSGFKDYMPGTPSYIKPVEISLNLDKNKIIYSNTLFNFIDMTRRGDSSDKELGCLLLNVAVDVKMLETAPLNEAFKVIAVNIENLTKNKVELGYTLNVLEEEKDRLLEKKDSFTTSEKDRDAIQVQLDKLDKDIAGVELLLKPFTRKASIERRIRPELSIPIKISKQEETKEERVRRELSGQEASDVEIAKTKSLHDSRPTYVTHIDRGAGMKASVAEARMETEVSSHLSGDNGLFIDGTTGSFAKDYREAISNAISGNKPEQILSYEKVHVQRELVEAENKAKEITSGRYKASLEKQIDKLKEALNVLADDREALLSQLKTLKNTTERQAIYFKVKVRQVTKSRLENQIAELDTEITILKDNHDNSILKDLTNKIDSYKRQIKRIDAGMSVEHFERVVNLHICLRIANLVLEELTYFTRPNDNTFKLRERLKTSIGNLALDERSSKLSQEFLRVLTDLDGTDKYQVKDRYEAFSRKYTVMLMQYDDLSWIGEEELNARLSIKRDTREVL